MSIHVRELTKIYGDQTAVNAVSFDVSPGDIVGFLGPNGAGKSTTMKILCGFIPQSSGHAEVCGYDVSAESLEVRRRIGYLPENNPLYVDLFVREYLEFVARLFGLEDRRARIERLIEMTGLGEERHKKIGQLSKGYRQRVGLAQAMMNDPEVLILDEPTSGLDPNQLEEIRSLIRRLGGEKTVLLSTHIMQEVQQLCKRVIIIDKGNIVADDTTESLQASSAADCYTVSFKEPVGAELLRGLPGVQSVEDLGDRSWRITCAPGAELREAVFRMAVERGFTLLNLNRETRSLEEVFRSLTKSPTPGKPSPGRQKPEAQAPI